jgi:hypothetical protein
MTEREIRARILKDFDVSAPREMIEAVKPNTFITIKDPGSPDVETATELGCLPKEFLIEANDLFLTHILWLRRKHPNLVMVYNRKTKLVAINLGD